MFNTVASHSYVSTPKSYKRTLGKNTLKHTSTTNVVQFPSQNENPETTLKNKLFPYETGNTQISMFQEDTTAITDFSLKPKHQKVLPIKTPDICKEVYKALLNSGRYGKRNAAIFALNLATGRRSSDILRFKISDVYDYTTNSIRTKISLKESKTGKMAIGLPLDKYTSQILESYIRSLKNRSPQAYRFCRWFLSGSRTVRNGCSFFCPATTA